MTMIDLLSIARGVIGRRNKITRQQMADILAAIADGGLYLGNGYMHQTVIYDGPDGRTGRATDQPHPGAPAAWANACSGITCISVMPNHVRFDEPGGMHPMQRSVLTFVPADIDAGRNDGSTIEYMRRHCRRLVLVRQDQPLPEGSLCAVLVHRWQKARNECAEEAIHLTDSWYADLVGLAVLSALHMLRHNLEAARGPMSGREVVAHLAPIIQLATGEAQAALQRSTGDEHLEIPGIPVGWHTTAGEE